MCSDVDKAGHTTDEAVAALAKSFCGIQRLVPGIKLASLEGDADRGGAIQNVFKGLVDKK